MDVERYRQQLLDLEATLSKRATREATLGRDQLIDTAADAGDESVADESESEDFTEAELDAVTLTQVREALLRIQNGTYGQCLVDGGPIEPKRLDAMPWTPYCLKHQKQRESGSKPKPTM
jgi:RNA polymerase-binding transcription factor